MEMHDSRVKEELYEKTVETKEDQHTLCNPKTV